MEIDYDKQDADKAKSDAEFVINFNEALLRKLK